MASHSDLNVKCPPQVRGIEYLVPKPMVLFQEAVDLAGGGRSVGRALEVQSLHPLDSPGNEAAELLTLPSGVCLSGVKWPQAKARVLLYLMTHLQMRSPKGLCYLSAGPPSPQEPKG